MDHMEFINIKDNSNSNIHIKKPKIWGTNSSKILDLGHLSLIDGLASYSQGIIYLCSLDHKSFAAKVVLDPKCYDVSQYLLNCHVVYLYFPAFIEDQNYDFSLMQCDCSNFHH